MIIKTDLQATEPNTPVAFLVRVAADGEKVTFELQEPVKEFTLLSAELREFLVRTKPNKSLP